VNVLILSFIHTLLAAAGCHGYFPDSAKCFVPSPAPLDLRGNSQPLVAIPMQQWSKIGKHALCAALAISREIKVVYVAEEDKCDEFRKMASECG
jgi:hypothetical protein